MYEKGGIKSSQASFHVGIKTNEKSLRNTEMNYLRNYLAYFSVLFQYTS